VLQPEMVATMDSKDRIQLKRDVTPHYAGMTLLHPKQIKQCFF